MGAISLKYKSKSGNLTAPGDVDPGAMIPIATTVVGAGGSSSITFSAIPSTYTHLQIRAISRDSRADVSNSLAFRFNSDSGANYTYHAVYGSGGSAGSFGAADQSQGDLFGSVSSTSSSSIFSAIISDILDYSNTSKYKTTRTLSGFDMNNTNGVIYLSSGIWRSTSAITSITILPQYGSSPTFSQYSHFALYGIKTAGA